MAVGAFVLRWTIGNALRFALRIISGIIIFNFAILENPQIFQNCLFTGSVLALSGAPAPALPKGEPLAKPYTSRFNRKPYRIAKASPFGRGGKAGRL